MFFDQYKQQLPDSDPVETSEWMQSLDEMVERAGKGRAQFLLYRLLKRARMLNLDMPPTTQTRYINTISPEQEPDFPGDEAMERRIRRLIRWNAVAMVHRANVHHAGLGGHLSSYASTASLYEVGFNHFFRGHSDAARGDLIGFQGHSAPGIYARAFLEGRLSQAQLEAFRRESAGGGLSSYPHPRLMPDFWEFPTVSMGLNAISSIYRARFARYLHAQGLADTSGQRVWAFLGDGEMDEPESLGALTLAAREGLDNLVFVVNCNLQRLDGPVRGNGKIIQELESVFRGAGWQVIKVLWGREWDPLLANDVDGLLIKKMNETPDGDWQRFTVESGAYIRQHFFGGDPRLEALVEHLSDADLQRLRRGGHDYRKIYAAYKAACEVEGRPTVVLAQTVKGWTLGTQVEGRNVTHQIKKLSLAELSTFRDRLELPIPDAELEQAPFYHPGPDSPEIQYLLERRRVLGGTVPRRIVSVDKPPAVPSALFTDVLGGTGDKLEVSTTMAVVRLLRLLMKDPQLGSRVVPIIPDEGRTFGMDPLYSEFKIYNPLGQRYVPVDAEFLISYREHEKGRILQEGITEAGAMASFTAAGTAVASHGLRTIPFYMFYSMFGFQRVADMIWAFADARGRGFLLGATAGRTTLNGEGLQHQDGHSHLMAATVPSCLAYDPAYAYEAAVIIEEGLQRMLTGPDDIFYYLTLYNENYTMPALPEGHRQDILRGMHRVREASTALDKRVQLLGSGPLLREALRAADLLEPLGVTADVFSVTSYTELRRDALECERQARQQPTAAVAESHVARLLRESPGPVVAVSDYLSALPDLVGRYVPRPLTVLGTDGFGLSDTRAALRRHFEIDAEHIALAALRALAEQGALSEQELVRGRLQLENQPAGKGVATTDR